MKKYNGSSAKPVSSSKKQKPQSWPQKMRKSGKRSLDRVGIVDVGSNSVRLVVFDGAARSPAYFYNEKILCGLGAGIVESGRLNPEGRARALVALKRFVLLAKGMKTGPLVGVATAAVREALDGPDFCREVQAATGLKLKVASGREEASLSAKGVLLGWPDARGLVCDIGGASMELAEVSKGAVKRCETSPLGPLKLAAVEGDDATVDAYIRGVVANLRAHHPKDCPTLFLVGGSWRAIARLDMERRGYPLKVLHEYQRSPEDFEETADWIATQDIEELHAMGGSSRERLRLVPMAARVLKALIAEFQPERIAISSYGIREGMLYEQMPKSLARRDPLLEACLHMERASARMPGFGKALFKFVAPLFAAEPPEMQRLIKAACLLHDVSWRAHPDYRAQVCFDNATRANLGGLDHSGRVFLGTALLHRYKNSRKGTMIDKVIGLMPHETMHTAELLGRAMRFGAMLSGMAVNMMGELKLHADEQVLELVLRERAEDLFGEVVETRFNALAESVGCVTRVTVR